MVDAMRHLITVRRAHGQRGGILFMFALLLPIFVIILYLLISASFSDVVLTQLQVAADNAAEAGASKLCSSLKPGTTCFDDARTAAINVLTQHSALSGLEGKSSFNIAAIKSSPADKWSWDESDLAGHNLRLTIERGVWGKEWGSDGNGPFMFQSVEDQSSSNRFDTAHPGIPRGMITNAVRVQILRPRTGIFGSKYYSLEATSVAVNGNPDGARVAPVALPICAFVTNDGNFYGDNGPEDSCLGDRIFTRGDRYAQQVDDIVAEGTFATNVVNTYPVPTFPWNPCSTAINPGPWPRSNTPDNGTWPDDDSAILPKNQFYITNEADYNTYVADKTCTDCPPWSSLQPSSGPTRPVCIFDHGQGRQSATTDAGQAGQQRFPQTQSRGGEALTSERQPSDHYGVFGVPGYTFTGSPNWVALETEIGSILGAGDGTKIAYLGQKFAVLDPGPSSTVTQTKLLDLMSIGAGGSPGQHPRADSTVLGTLEGTYSTFGWSNSTVRNCNPGVDDPDVTCGAIDPAKLSRDGVVWWAGPSIGMNPLEGYCGSRRAAFANFQVSYGPGVRPKSASPSWNITAGVAHTGFDTDGAWDTLIPVIAPLDANNNLACVGTHGRTLSNTVSDPVVQNADNWIVVGFVRSYLVDADINNPMTPPTVSYNDGTNTYQHTLANWGFLGDTYNPDPTNAYVGTLTSNIPPADGSGIRSCNMARARLRCESEKPYLPSADGTAKRRPRLVQ